MRRYLVLLGLAFAVGLALVPLARRARIAAPRDTEADGARFVDLALVVTPEFRVAPESAAVPRDARVRLAITNRYRGAVSLALMGYQDRFGATNIPPDSTWRGEFLADRPGEDFAWVLEGAPVGRLRVTGSHLVEGHR